MRTGYDAVLGRLAWAVAVALLAIVAGVAAVAALVAAAVWCCL